ncbi:MAG: ribosome small subunit-dependent GTPase A [Bacteroidia bacterium]|nr:ribosome small subunit-dependent GTPase A [Bacteroidia bacterium]
MKQGIVVKSTGSWYDVKGDDGHIIACRIIGKFRLKGLGLTNPVAVGDRVSFEMEADDKGIIKKIASRSNYVVRQSPRKKHQLHLLASNIDQAILVMTIVHPNLKQGFIDRFLLMTEPHDIPVIIVFNKSDLYKADDMEIFEVLKMIYQDIGYQVMLVSALEKTGIEELKQALAEKITLVCGQSGVGKSSLMRAIDPELDIKVKEISDYSGKGQHTTTFAEMYKIGSGHIIDTPGIKTLSFNNLSTQDVAHNFREIFKESEHCKFGNCQHREEPGCAVKEAIEDGRISELRHDNYLKIIDEIEEQNYWERHKHM